LHPSRVTKSATGFDWVKAGMPPLPDAR